ncbi:hypothetical protein JCM21714_3166 [Gracilibacillus boraciitolerans JCM 21714]|uniref:DUF3993 domain-containing protein n=1 Tax=Gracilibacillus boraciitolerans JCM 21714 TaxID=1298598 RepID=W4VLL0_9BACI|nr:hypothetical protein [Gracilibacillus boraciitolerans]GAE94036.1 hypothetical protein JCM21714_3166 [Gracilibacillus boraciitolerans JCM 21714]
MKKIITMGTIIVLSAFAIFMVNQPQMDQAYAIEKKAHAQKNNEQKVLQFEDIQQLTQKEAELSHEQIITLTDTFMELLVQKTDEQYKVVEFNTKVELIQAFEPYVKKEAVQPYIDFYYQEQEDGLYIVPTETPAWFENDVEYQKEKTDDGKVKVTQINKNELHGKYTIVITFEQVEGIWRIVNISHE